MEMDLIMKEMREFVNDIVYYMERLEIFRYDAPYITVERVSNMHRDGYRLTSTDDSFSVDIYLDSDGKVSSLFGRELTIYVNERFRTLNILLSNFTLTIKFDAIMRMDSSSVCSETGEYSDDEPLCTCGADIKIVLRNGSVIYINADLGKYYCAE